MSTHASQNHIDTASFINDTGCSVDMLYALIGRSLADLEAILDRDGLANVHGHRFRGTLQQLYISGGIIEHLTGLTDANKHARSSLLREDISTLRALF